MSIANYLTVLDEQRDALARNLAAMGVSASESEKLNTLVPKVLQIPQTKSNVTLFQSGIDALHDYGETIYTFYNDGYRSLSGFAETYPNFCCEDNGYALSYNMTDFGWAGEVFTISTTPVAISSGKSILFSYKSGSTEAGVMYLVKKPEDEKTAYDLAQYVYEQIQSESAVTINFNWLYADSYITTLHSCKNVSPGEYLLAWKGVSDNTHPLIRTIKILEV